MLRPPVFMIYGEFRVGSGVEFFTDRIRTRIIVDSGAILTIGDKVTLNDVFTIRASREIRIGEGTGIGPLVTIYDSNFHEVYPGDTRGPKPVIIGEDCAIGEKSGIYRGVEIGSHTFVGAGSIVTRSLPSMVMAAGNPATVVANYSNKFEGIEKWRRLNHH